MEGGGAWGWGFFFQAEDGIRDYDVTGVQTCALPIFAEVLFDGAIDERERCDEEKLIDRIWLMKRIISDFWNKDKARSSN